MAHECGFEATDETCDSYLATIKKMCDMLKHHEAGAKSAKQRFEAMLG
jgi:hypothetical protein